MQISHRELTLQKIIKSQEARISQLQKQLASNPSVYKERQLQAVIMELSDRLTDKEKEGIQIKTQLHSLKGDLRSSREDKRVAHDIQKEKDILANYNAALQKQRDTLVAIVKQLEAKVQVTISAYQKQIDKLLKTNQNLLKQAGGYKQNMMSIELEIEKLQIFYRSSIHQLPKRKETLTWVGNLVKFIDKYEELLRHHPLEKESDCLQKSLSSLGDTMGACSQEIKNTLTERFQQMRRLKEDISVIVVDNEAKYQQVLEENKVFWQQCKRENTHQSGESEKRLDEENRRIKQEYQSKYHDLMKQFRGVEHEKREIILAIQELKSYYENRENNYKEEIALLKSTEMRLIEYSEKREQIFESEILRLTGEVTYLGKMYETSSRNNTSHERQRFESDILRQVKVLLEGNFKAELSGAIASLELKQTHLEREMSNMSEKELKALQQVKTCCDSLMEIRKIINDGVDLLKEESVQEEEYEETFSVDMVRFQELEERKNYEMSLLKKKNERLHQTNAKLQQKNKDESTPKGGLTLHSLQQKISELQDQNSLLVLQNSKYKTQFNSSLRKLSRMPLEILPGQLQSMSNEIQKIQSLLYQHVLPVIKQQTIKQEEYASTIEQSLKRVLHLVEYPFEHINGIVKKYGDISGRGFQDSNRVIEINVNFNKEIRQYKELLEVRTSSVSLKQTNKLLGDLVQSIRSTLPPRQHNRSTLKETENNNVERKSVKTRTGFQQRLKEIQTARICDKNQLHKYLLKVEQSLKKVDTGKHTLTKSSQILSRIESTLGKVVREVAQILDKPHSEKQSRELASISKRAIQDLQSKLRESVCENEGLAKEYKLLGAFQSIKEKKQ